MMHFFDWIPAFAGMTSGETFKESSFLRKQEWQAVLGNDKLTNGRLGVYSINRSKTLNRLLAIAWLDVVTPCTREYMSSTAAEYQRDAPSHSRI